MEMHELYKPYGMVVLPEGKEINDFRDRWVCIEEENDKEIIGGDIPSWCPLPTRAYLNKDVIAELEKYKLVDETAWVGCMKEKSDMATKIIALLRGDGK